MKNSKAKKKTNSEELNKTKKYKIKTNKKEKDKKKHPKLKKAILIIFV